jgi:hypothetical protein
MVLCFRNEPKDLVLPYVLLMNNEDSYYANKFVSCSLTPSTVYFMSTYRLKFKQSEFGTDFDSCLQDLITGYSIIKMSNFLYDTYDNSLLNNRIIKYGINRKSFACF